MRLRAARAASLGVRQPLQVMRGNHHVLPGECPWFDKVREGA